MHMTVANVILEQLGGRKFAVMTGAKNFIGLESGLEFRLPGGGGFTKSGINLVRVELTPADLYKVTFSKFRMSKGLPSIKKISEFDGIYFDQLQPLFSRETGLATRL
jgi:hypothetical protein